MGSYAEGIFVHKHKQVEIMRDDASVFYAGVGTVVLPSWRCSYYDSVERVVGCEGFLPGMDNAYDAYTQALCSARSGASDTLYDRMRQEGGLYMGITQGYDPLADAMSDKSCSELTGMLLGAMQSMGVPVVLLTREALWTDGYAGVAAMLGLRRGLVSFGFQFSGTTAINDIIGSTVSERLAGIDHLHKGGMQTWAYIECVDNDDVSRDDIVYLVSGLCDRGVDYIYIDGVAEGTTPEVVNTFCMQLVTLCMGSDVKIYLSDSIMQMLGDYMTDATWRTYAGLNPVDYDRLDVSSGMVVAQDITGIVTEVVEDTARVAVSQCK